MKKTTSAKALKLLPFEAFVLWAIRFEIVFRLLPTPLFCQTDSSSIWVNKALEKTSLGQQDSADFYINHGLSFFRAADDLNNWIQAQNKIAKIFRDEKNQPDQANIWYMNALQNAWRKPNSELEWVSWANLHLSIGYNCSDKKYDFICARKYYEVGRSILQDSLHHRNLRLANFVLTPLGNIYARTRDFDKALHYLRDAWEICKEQKAWNNAAIAANGIGLKFATKNEHQKAIKWYKEGFSFPELDPESKVLLMLNLGWSLAEIHQLDSALLLTYQAQQILEQLPDQFTPSMRFEHWADLHDNFGYVAQQHQQWEAAETHYRHYIDFYIQKFGGSNNRQVAQCNLKLGNLFGEWGRPDSALHYAQIALQCLLPKVQLGNDFDNPSVEKLYAEHTLTSAFKLKIKALLAFSARTPDNPAIFAQCLENCDLLFTTDEILRREYAFEESKLHRQAVNREYYEAALSAVYRLGQLTHDPALAERAFQYAEQARERLLAEVLLEHEVAAMAEIPAETRRQLTALQVERAQLQVLQFEKNIRGEENTPTVDSLESLLFEKHLAWKTLLESYEKKQTASPRPPQTDLNALRDLLQPDQAMLEYFVGDSALYVFVLTKNDLRVVRRERPDSLESAVENLRKSLTDGAYQFSRRGTVLFGKSASMLYDWLVAEPLSMLPESVRSLLIVPDGILGYVPFEALGPSQGRIDFSTFPYLIRRYTVSYAGSGNLLLAQNRQASHTDKRMKLFAGFAPKYSGSDVQDGLVSRARGLLLRDSLPNLPGAVKEVRDIAKLLNGTAYIGAEATEQQFKAQAARYRILHLAMHAYVEDSNPLFSKMLFTRPPNDAADDGDLNSNELYAMRLPADMAVLSACQTGLGELRRGEGIVSLSRAFAYAGVPATVVSLWSVSDAATAEVMVNFYQNLKIGQRKDEALRQAKLKYLSGAEALSASPYYWASFIASGEMGALFHK